jgi:uncharacterized protein (TIGR02145 family)
MYQRIILLILLPFLGFSQVPQAINNNLFTKSSSFNLDELKVRWKKAALENCPRVPCVVAPSFTCGTSTVTDVDGNVYNTVSIGTQCWTKENLKVTKYNDGTAIPLNNTYTSGTVSTVWYGLTTGAYTIYDNESSTGANATNYGFLYNWYAAKGITTVGSTTYKNLCPTGYHVPTDTEWSTLVIHLDNSSTSSTGSYTSIIAGGKMKQTGTTLWNTPNTGATNESGFSALPGGFRNSVGGFYNIGISAAFWSTTEGDGIHSFAWYRFLSHNLAWVGKADHDFYSVGFSVRCLRD